jgi:uncharacterized protein GlcG (DUF336 family)
MTVTLALAKRMLDAAEAEAERLGVAMAIAVVDAGGAPVAMRRMDGATMIAAVTVQAKARTAVYFGRPTTDVVESARRHPPVYGSLLGAAEESLVYSMGGTPIVMAGSIVGGIGASGGTGEQDVLVSLAGLRAVEVEP